MKKIKWLFVALCSLMALGIAMPSCPGQKAVQTQIETLEKNQADLIKKVGSLESQLKAAAMENAKTKEILSQLGSSLQLQEASLRQLESTVKGTHIKPSIQKAKGSSKNSPRGAAKKKGR
ncbi:MAG: hypothetical protein AABZ06_14890 [Bdellovibrionota bacterium]